ncbi:hypothetical protein F3Y22_tig00109960pilonHSYRG00026 [Hibiscus syriacus]|uniref:apyrase n=1 Tax=Hibiscus syriacus TaxID=106335 RepID=A0A6A3BTY9_HIBSY|nr:hypothetical protein F3Y22_tig00109960pilonHSYRG00026 [Hibiscus syriacus]
MQIGERGLKQPGLSSPGNKVCPVVNNHALPPKFGLLMRRSHARNRKSTTDPQKMDPIKLQILSKSRSTALFPRNPRQTKPFPSFIAVSMAISLALFAFVYILFLPQILRQVQHHNRRWKHGDENSRVRYKVDEVRNSIFDFKEGLESLKVIRDCRRTLRMEGVADSLEELLEFGRSKVPKNQWGETRSGWCLGCLVLSSATWSSVITAEVVPIGMDKDNFLEYPRFLDVGSDEVYAWVVANYVLGTLGGNPLRTTGIIELGGASAQVTFFSSETMPSEFSRSISSGISLTVSIATAFSLWAECCTRVLRESLIKGDFSPAAESTHKEMYTDPSMGNFSECRSAALMLLQKGKGCAKGHSSDLIMAGQHFCEEDWSKLKETPIIRRKIFCATVFLQHISWLYFTIALKLLWMMMKVSILKWRKPQLKTVYDLEKGRYIVTRIGRS